MKAKSFSLKPAEVTRKWYVIDATEAPLGRISTVAARLLIGKDKPTFTPHVDGGDYVIVINADRLIVTGDKEDKKIYYRHSNYPGGLYQKTLRESLQADSTKVIQQAVRGMLPANKLRPGRLERLKIYTGDAHNHSAQTPEVYSVKKGKK